jgi:hypothetical protein
MKTTVKPGYKGINMKAPVMHKTHPQTGGGEF